MRRLTGPSVLLVLALAGCVGPAGTPAGYEAKAGQAAAEGLSHLRTALLTVRTSVDGQLPAAYEETVLVDAEEGVGSVRASFDSIQPPADPGSDRLRAELDTLLADAGDGVTDLRIAARRGDPAQLAATARKLTPVADELEAFGEDHPG
ncbi:MAG: hypothetical protein ACJ73E_14460 [Mycobacteriales bacterium]